MTQILIACRRTGYQHAGPIRQGVWADAKHGICQVLLDEAAVARARQESRLIWVPLPHVRQRLQAAAWEDERDDAELLADDLIRDAVKKA